MSHPIAQETAIKPSVKLTSFHQYLQEGYWKGDLMASFIVFLVSLPLNLGLAQAAGAPPIWGLVSAVLAGLLIGAISGSPLRVSGPADSGVAFVAAINSALGLQPLGLIVFFAGVIQFVAGRLKLGHWFRAITPSVIHGMLSGIGVMIAASQLHAIIDVKPQHQTLLNLETVPHLIELLLRSPEKLAHQMAFVLGVVTLLIFIVWQSPKLPKPLKRIPPALMAVISGTLIAHWFHFPVQYITFPKNLFEAIPFGQMFQQFDMLKQRETWSFILGLATVLSAETLVDGMAVDKLKPGHKTYSNWDLSAQGIGNMLCGLFGTMPISGVIVRSVANITSGANTRMSCVFLGIWLLFAITLGQDILRSIPKSCLSGVLIYVGYQLINPAIYKETWRTQGKNEFIILLATAISVVLGDPLLGVIVGMVLALADLLYKASQLTMSLNKTVSLEGEEKYDMYLKGAATFVRLPLVSEALEALPHDAHIDVHLHQLTSLDHAFLSMLEEWQERHSLQGAKVTMLFKEAFQEEKPKSSS
ncbi:MAG: SulP family inorganic anion transporter [Vampirovibrionales bacterium]